ncbi:ankyrin [Piromyces finnis]|uniref:Ankyrin n=1 Tax=Piromyces finnis TaxID=1754191 RepID=A0A1Y1UWQ1_9FUNG|nr:ankyrin [Piromyces finnis]|eukprot:ORX42527.1 ankyrin [Piromyces finnis]
MKYYDIENKLLSKLEKNKNPTQILDDNKKIISEYLIKDYGAIDNFNQKLIPIILKAKNFDNIEKAINHPLLFIVLSRLRESDVLIQACQSNDYKMAVKWLIKLKINLNIKDKMGMNALMHASEHYALDNAVKEMLKTPEIDIINDEDINGNTALFHAIKNKEIFDTILEKTTKLNHINKENENIIIYICKHNKVSCLEKVLPRVANDTSIDINYFNKQNRNALMYLAENCRFREIKKFYKQFKNLSINSKNKNGESLVSIFIKKFYDFFSNMNNIECFNEESLISDIAILTNKVYGRTMDALIDIGCNFNISIDGDGNTPMNFFLMIKDYVSALNLICYCFNLDLSIPNKYGVSANHLICNLTKEDFKIIDSIKNYIFININYDIFKEKAYMHPTFKYCDIKNKTLISPYDVPSNLSIMESHISIGYYYRNSEKELKNDLFEKLSGGVKMSKFISR